VSSSLPIGRRIAMDDRNSLEIGIDIVRAEQPPVEKQQMRVPRAAADPAAEEGAECDRRENALASTALDEAPILAKSAVALKSPREEERRVRKHRLTHATRPTSSESLG